MVAIVYVDGVYKNWMLHEWEMLNGGPYPTYSFKNKFTVEDPYYTKIKYSPKGIRPITFGRVYPPAVCGQAVATCINDVYSNHGWISVGLFVATLVDPAVPAGVVAGCMLHCMLRGPYEIDPNDPFEQYPPVNRTCYLLLC